MRSYNTLFPPFSCSDPAIAALTARYASTPEAATCADYAAACHLHWLCGLAQRERVTSISGGCRRATWAPPAKQVAGGSVLLLACIPALPDCSYPCVCVPLPVCRHLCITSLAGMQPAVAAAGRPAARLAILPGVCQLGGGRAGATGRGAAVTPSTGCCRFSAVPPAGHCWGASLAAER